MALVVDTICLYKIFPFLRNDALALGFVGYVCSKKCLPPFPSQFHASAGFITIFIGYFLVISRRISLVSNEEIAV
jgi:hypothetical protein